MDTTFRFIFKYATLKKVDALPHLFTPSPPQPKAALHSTRKPPYTRVVYAGIPIIGLAGGIGSGKSHIAGLFGELGCAVIDSDAQAHAAYLDPNVRQTLRRWWGDEVFHAGGAVNRAAVAGRVFNNPAERRQLEALIHPMVARARDEAMRSAAEAGTNGGQPLAFVWDTPLLFEAGLKGACDAVVFVDAPGDVRLDRLVKSRGWDERELARREILQLPLDKKKQLSDDVIRNSAEADDLRNQVRQVLSRILTRLTRFPGLY